MNASASPLQIERRMVCGFHASAEALAMITIAARRLITTLPAAPLPAYSVSQAGQCDGAVTVSHTLQFNERSIFPRIKMKFFDKKQNALPIIGHLAVGRGTKKREGPPMHRRTFLLGFLGTLGAAPALVAAVFPIEAAPLSEALSQPRPAPSSTGGGDLDMDTEKVASEWSQYAYRRGRRVYRRTYRTTRRVYRRAYRRGVRWRPYDRALLLRGLTSHSEQLLNRLRSPDTTLSANLG